MGDKKVFGGDIDLGEILMIRDSGMGFNFPK